MDGIFGARETRDFDISEKNTSHRGTRRARERETRQSVRCEYHKPINRRSSRVRSRTSSTLVSQQTTTKSLCLESARDRSRWNTLNPGDAAPSPLANFQTRLVHHHTGGVRFIKGAYPGFMIRGVVYRRDPRMKSVPPFDFSIPDEKQSFMTPLVRSLTRRALF